MSAIFGYLLRDGRAADPSTLVRMSSRLAHRGPDGDSVWCEGPVGLGRRILRTAPSPSQVERPLARRDRTILAADARIDNREELVRELDLPSRLEETPDEELILAAYRAWGRGAPERLIGDFAFAIWDGRRQTLFCARDPIGVRPFLYHLSDRLFAFASEAKALFCLPEVPRELDEVQVAFFLDSFLDDPERTFHRNILRLPAAHFLEVDSDRGRMERYWSPDPTREIRYPSDEQYAEAFRERFVQAVQSCLRDAVPVGAALSGGLDSSSIVCAARQLLPPDQPVHAFSAVFPGLPEEERRWNDESPYIDAVAEAEGIVSHRVNADRIPPLFDYERVLEHFDEPPLGFNLYWQWALFKIAREEGIRVYLDGLDGDTVVDKGYTRFIDLAREERWSAVTEEILALAQRYETPSEWFLKSLIYPLLTDLARSGQWGRWWQGCNRITAELGRSRGDLLARCGIGAFVPTRVWDLYRGMRGVRSMSLIHPDLARRVRLTERKRALETNGSRKPVTGRQSHAQAVVLPRFQFALELMDGTASAFSIELRYPFFDRRLVEFCLAVPPEQKLADGWTRLIQRRGMEGIIPPKVQWRVHKGRLGYSLIRGMREVEGPRLGAMLFGEPSVLDDYVDMERLRSTYGRFFGSDSSPRPGQTVMQLYEAAVLARWLRDHGPDTPLRLANTPRATPA